MAFLAFCWLIIELRIIPNGFLKWFYLSFYIHPLFLFFCQIFLWLNEVQKLAVLLLLAPFKITLFIALLISKFLKRVAIILFSFGVKKIKKPEFFADDDHDVNQRDDGGVVNSQEYMFESGAATVNASDHSSTQLTANRPLLIWNPGRKRRANLAQPELQSSKSSWLNEFLLSDYYTKCLSTYYSNDAGNLSSHGQKDTCSSDINGLHPSITQGFSLKLQDFEPQLFLDEEMLRMSYEGDNLPDHRAYLASDLSQTNALVDVCSPSPCSSDSPKIALEPEQRLSSEVSEKDPYSRSFHQKYTERMRWFDVLYQDRLCGIRHPIQHVMNPSAKISTKKILRSLESDLELVYIAKLCLIWEALHYQYRKVESLAELSDGNLLLFHADISEKFQKFKIILERFMEGEKCHQGKKYLDFLCDRISFNGLLQIPDVTGCVKKEENRSMQQVGEEAMIKANEVLKMIEKCMQVFWLYVEKDHKNDKKYVKVISWRNRPPVEDPRDLHLLYHLTNALRKKLLLLHGMQAKKKCWFRRRSVKPVQEECDHEKDMELVFGAIDLELVRKVTKMSTISTSHLAWCQHKLNNVEFRQGRMFRAPATCLFPS